MAASVNRVILVGNLGKDPMQEPKGPPKSLSTAPDCRNITWSKAMTTMLSRAWRLLISIRLPGIRVEIRADGKS
jgi:hypothetical protein